MSLLGHLQTILPHLLRNNQLVSYRRERITLPDTDFLDLDHVRPISPVLANTPHVLILHGLEGNSGSSYIVGMAYYLSRAGYGVTAINFRGCSGELNRLPRFYHSGATEDVAATVQHLVALTNRPIFLIGFSLGGNQCLKFMGELQSRWANLSTSVVGAVALSVPLDLAACSAEISLPSNHIYEKRFIKSLGDKIRRKQALMPTEPLLNTKQLGHINILKDFDDFYTAPLHGYPDADTYYAANSSLGYLQAITHPTLIMQADNDPFLALAIRSSEVVVSRSTELLITQGGGHCGWLMLWPQQGSFYWCNVVALQRLKALIS